MRRTSSTAVKSSPKTAISTGGSRHHDPSVTNVSGVRASTAPAFLSPRNARNIPMPTVTENFKWFGIARTRGLPGADDGQNHEDRPPEIATAPSAVCHRIF